MSSPLNANNRLFGIDFLKLLVIFPIVQFHMNEFIFETNVFPLSRETIFYDIFSPYSMVMSFSGFAIILISFFLFGYKNKNAKSLLKLTPILIAGQLVVNKAFTRGDAFIKFEWDIYIYLAVSIFCLAAIRNIKRKKTLLLILFLTLIAPYKAWLADFPHLLSNHVLFSYCLENEKTTWAIVPWIVFPAFSFILGQVAASLRLKTIGWRELSVWGVALGAASLSWGDFSPTPIGDSFYCFTFNRSTVSLWSHLAGILFLLRISLVESVNQFLSRRSLFRFVSNRMWARKLWLCYLIQVGLLGVASQFTSVFYQRPALFDVLFVLLFPMVELLAVWSVELVEKFKKA